MINARGVPFDAAERISNILLEAVSVAVPLRIFMYDSTRRVTLVSAEM